MKLTPITKFIIALIVLDIALSATMSILQPDVQAVRSILSTLELAALVTTMTVVVWRVLRSF